MTDVEQKDRNLLRERVPRKQRVAQDGGGRVNTLKANPNTPEDETLCPSLRSVGGAHRPDVKFGGVFVACTTLEQQDDPEVCCVKS